MSQNRSNGRQQPAVAQQQTTPGDRAALVEHRDSLSRRLEQGYAKIERGLAAGQNVTAWEDLWISLLREYERICDEIDRAADLAA